jgi:hypothetical protein
VHADRQATPDAADRPIVPPAGSERRVIVMWDSETSTLMPMNVNGLYGRE